MLGMFSIKFQITSKKYPDSDRSKIAWPILTQKYSLKCFLTLVLLWSGQGKLRVLGCPAGLQMVYGVHISILPFRYAHRPQTSYTALCNGVVSHGAPTGGIGVFADHTRRNKRKQNASMIFTGCAAFHAYLSSCSSLGTYAPDKSQLFWSWEKPEYPKLSPMGGGDKNGIETPVHFDVAVGNCGLCMRWRLAFSSCTHIMHTAVVIMRPVRYDSCAKH